MACNRALPGKHGLVGSVGRKGNCRDNSVAERVWQRDYANHAGAVSDIADAIVNFYKSAPTASTRSIRARPGVSVNPTPRPRHRSQ